MPVSRDPDRVGHGLRRPLLVDRLGRLGLGDDLGRRRLRHLGRRRRVLGDWRLLDRALRRLLLLRDRLLERRRGAVVVQRVARVPAMVTAHRAGREEQDEE